MKRLLMTAIALFSLVAALATPADASQVMQFFRDHPMP